MVQPAPSAVAVQLVAVSPQVYELKWTPPPAAPLPLAQIAATPVAQAYGLEVSNGNGITGMARRVGQMLAVTGLPQARLTNQKPFVQQFTQIQHRGGYELAAMELQARIPSMPVLVLNKTLRPGTDVRLVLGRDLPANVTLLEPAPGKDWLAAVPPRTFAESN